jgi:hypothetical protein
MPVASIRQQCHLQMAIIASQIANIRGHFWGAAKTPWLSQAVFGARADNYWLVAKDQILVFQ